MLEVVQPGPAELSQRWQADARGRAAAAVERALDNWEALASQPPEPPSRGLRSGSTPNSTSSTQAEKQQ